jgi:hypothetical protein
MATARRGLWVGPGWARRSLLPDQRRPGEPHGSVSLDEEKGRAPRPGPLSPRWPGPPRLRLFPEASALTISRADARPDRTKNDNGVVMHDLYDRLIADGEAAVASSSLSGGRRTSRWSSRRSPTPAPANQTRTTSETSVKSCLHLATR